MGGLNCLHTGERGNQRMRWSQMSDFSTPDTSAGRVCARRMCVCMCICMCVCWCKVDIICRITYKIQNKQNILNMKLYFRDEHHSWTRWQPFLISQISSTTITRKCTQIMMVCNLLLQLPGRIQKFRVAPLNNINKCFFFFNLHRE